MAGPWEQYQQQLSEPSGPWNMFQPSTPAGPRVASGISDALEVGWQGSVPGLIDRGKLPDIVLDPQHSKWYERAAAGASQLFHEFPEMLAGSVAGASAGGATGGLVGSVFPGIGTAVGAATGATVGGGAAAFAVPTAIRESLIQAYEAKASNSSGDFLARTSIVLKRTAEDALIGAVTAGAGKAFTVGAQALGAGAKVAGATGVTAEIGALVVTPAALEGRLPEPQEFMDAAILLGGLKGAGFVAGKLRETYAKTGKTPMEVMADAQRDPTITQDLIRGAEEPVRGEPKIEPGKEPKPGEQLDLFPEERIPRAYQELAREENARNAVPDPSPEAARFLDQPFAKVPQLPGEPILPTHVNYNYLNTTSDVKGAMSRLSDLYETKVREQTRGTVSWEQTYAEARALFQDATGEKAPALPLGTADYAKLSADLYARKQLLTSGAEQMMAAREAYTKAREAGTATDQMKLELLAQIDRVAQAQAEVRGTQAEVGRALNVLKSTNRDKAYYDQLNEVINGRFNTDGKFVKGGFDEMVDLLGTMGTPGEALAAAERISKATTMDKIVEAWKAGLVSGPTTQVANILGNVTFAATRPVVDTVAVAFSLARSNPDRVRAVEPLARVVGMAQGVIDGAKVAGTVLKTGEAYGSKPDAHRNAISGVKGEIIRAPFRLLSASDAFFRVINERGEAYALATRQAAAEGFNPATREFREKVAEIVANPTEKMQGAIDAAGERFTFQAPLGKVGQSVQDVLAAAPVLKFFVPFVQTPTNVAKEMLRLTPAAPFVKEWREAVAAGGASRDKALGELAFGTAVGGTVMALALSGKISGQGDPDPKKRAAQMAAGWQPYSVLIDGKWHSYQRLQPLGTLVGMAADSAQVWDSMNSDEQDKIPKIMTVAFANAITNQTFLQGITNVINAVSDPQRFGPRFVQNFAASFVPAIVGQPAQMMDPYQREVNSIMDAVKARLPGVREDLLTKRDIFGEPIAAKDRMGAISPITTATPSTDKVRLEVARLGIGVAKAPDHIELPAGKDSKLGKVMLTPEQRDIFSDKAGHMAHQILTAVVNSPGWDTVPDMAQRAAVEKVFEASRKYGKAMAVPPEQLVREAQRISNELQIRLQPK